MRLPFRKKKKLITTLEIGEQWLKVIQVDASRDENEIVNLMRKEIGDLSDYEIVEVLKELINEVDINSEYLITSVPRHLATTRNFELPSTDPKEIKDMIELQIGKQTPYTQDEVISDYKILDKSKEGYSKIMLVIVPRKIIKRYFKIVEGAGLRLEKVGLSSEGLLYWKNVTGKEEETYVLIDIGYSSSDFEVISESNLKFGRNISLGYSQFEDQMENWEKKFTEEINHSIYAYQNEVVGGDINKIVITGPEILIDELNDVALQEETDLPVTITEQFENISVVEKALDLYDLTGKKISFAPLIGFGFGYEEKSINLIPKEKEVEREVKERGKDVFTLGILLVFILITISGVFLVRMYNKDQYLGRLKDRLGKIEAKVKRLNSMVKKIKFVSKREETRNVILDYLYSIHKNVSPKMHLISVSFDQNNGLTIRGTSNSTSDVLQFVDKLEKTENFKDVKTKYVTARKVEGKEVTDFEIVCLIQ